MKSKIDWIRRSQRVIRMVSELHRMGYQKLRIMPYVHPNAWRLAIAPSEYFSPRHGAIIPWKNLDRAVIYSAAAGNMYFEWQDAKTDDARKLAEKFLIRFPEIARRGYGRDWHYAGWLCELLAFLERDDWLPVTSWKYMKGAPEELEALPIWSAFGANLAWEGEEAMLDPGTPAFLLPPVLPKETRPFLFTKQTSDEITLLHMGVEGGDIRLVLRMTMKGIYSFAVVSDSSESAFFDEEDLPDESCYPSRSLNDSPLVIDWPGALKLLDEQRSMWPLFEPFYVHPSISRHIPTALKERYPLFPEINFEKWEALF